MSEREIDQALVVRVQQGDKKAFDLLVLKYQLRLSKLVSRFLRNQSDPNNGTRLCGARPEGGTNQPTGTPAD